MKQTEEFRIPSALFYSFIIFTIFCVILAILIDTDLTKGITEDVNYWWHRIVRSSIGLYRPTLFLAARLVKILYGL